MRRRPRGRGTKEEDVMLRLNTIKAQPGATHYRKRLGRGSGSGHGPTAGKGDKGQLQRSGGKVRPGFEGGQMPLYRRIPKRGFNNFARRTTAVLNLHDLERFDNKLLKEVTLETLTSANLIKGRFDRLTILGTGVLKKAFVVKAHKISQSAQDGIKKAGGSFEMIAIPGPQKRAVRVKPGKAAKLAKAAKAVK
jgi:large subunit ribosomal protein L15